MTRAKGLKRVETEIDVVRLIRRMFVVDYLTKHLMSPAKMAEITKKESSSSSLIYCRTTNYRRKTQNQVMHLIQIKAMM
jgi:hypothetical protein